MWEFERVLLLIKLILLPYENISIMLHKNSKKCNRVLIKNWFTVLLIIFYETYQN